MLPSDLVVPFKDLPDSPEAYKVFEAMDPASAAEGEAPKLKKGDWLALCRVMGHSDLYFMMRFVLSSRLAPRINDGSRFIFDRCRDVQEHPNGRVDIWSREHYKSTIITFGLTVFELMRNPELTFGIFSHSRPIAKQFLRQIKEELEKNDLLKECFPDVCWSVPHKEASKWSEDSGIVLKRNGNPKEQSVEAWGLVDGQPTSKHFDIKVYDDVVTRESVTTPEQISKTTSAWELSLSLGKEGGHNRYIGTRYHANDTYATIMSRGAAETRIFPCVAMDSSGSAQLDKPVLYTPEYIEQQRKGQGSSTFSAQWLCDPLADSTMGFQREWLRYYTASPVDVGRATNKYILVDPANMKRKDCDYTAMWVIGLGSDRNYYVLDILRDRLNLLERWNALHELHSFWRPVEVRYEQYGMQADVSYIEQKMDELNYRFDIVEVRGNTRKEDRIRRLTPLFEEGRIFLPKALEVKSLEGEYVDLVSAFVNDEYCNFPVSSHDDQLDALARIAEPDLPLRWPAKMSSLGRYRDKPREPISPDAWMYE